MKNLSKIETAVIYCSPEIYRSIDIQLRGFAQNDMKQIRKQETQAVSGVRIVKLWIRTTAIMDEQSRQITQIGTKYQSKTYISRSSTDR